MMIHLRLRPNCALVVTSGKSNFGIQLRLNLRVKAAQARAPRAYLGAQKAAGISMRAEGRGRGYQRALLNPAIFHQIVGKRGAGGTTLTKM